MGFAPLTTVPSFASRKRVILGVSCQAVRPPPNWIRGRAEGRAEGGVQPPLTANILQRPTLAVKAILLALSQSGNDYPTKAADGLGVSMRTPPLSRNGEQLSDHYFYLLA